MLPSLRESDRAAVLAALKETGTLDALLALAVDSAIRVQFRAQVEKGFKQTAEGEPLNVRPWINDFIADARKGTQDTGKDSAKAADDSGNKAERADNFKERDKDIHSFDILLQKHPEIFGRLKAQGIDLDAEKARERERLRSENPGMPEEEAGTRSALAVYLRHEKAIREAAPDESARKEIDAGFEKLRAHARDAGIPYQETLRNAAGILPADKAAIAAATGAGLDTRVTRVGNALYFDSPGDRVRQVWTLRPGDRPEKSVEIPGGPRLTIATAPDIDGARAMKKHRALDKIADITQWPSARTPEGFDTAKRRFPAYLDAAKSSAASAPESFAGFVLRYLEAPGEKERMECVASMRETASRVQDAGLRRKAEEAAVELADADARFLDRRDLLEEYGRKLESQIREESAAANRRADGKLEAFKEAARTVDAIESEEKTAMLQFREQTAQREKIARDNLAYLEANGFLAFGTHFDAFLATLNRNALAIDPQAGGELTLPKKLSEKDKALLAAGLVKAIGQDAKAGGYFEIPGYRLKRADESGAPITTERIRAELERGRILEAGAFRANALEARFTSNDEPKEDDRK